MQTDLETLHRDALTELKNAYDNPPREQHGLARPLGYALLNAMTTPDHPGRYDQFVDLPGRARMSVRQFGYEIIDAMWPEKEGPESQARMQEVLGAIDAITDPSARRAWSEMLGKFGHIHQISGLLQRERVLDQATSPKTAESFLSGEVGPKKNWFQEFTSAEKAVTALNQPKMELTFTAHPTNTNGMSGMVAQRQIAVALNQWKTDPGARDAVAEAIKAYANAPLLPERNNDLPGLTVRNETDYMLYFLNNLYSDLDAVYATYDTHLGEKFTGAEGGTAYHPETLLLNLGFHSWGSSGDKDGNKSVNADTTLYALSAHYQWVLMNYQRELKNIPGLEGWKKSIDHAQAETSAITKEINRVLDTDGVLGEKAYDILAGRLKDAVAGNAAEGVPALDKKTFLADLQKAYAAAPDGSKQPTLSLLRHVHNFGFSFGRIEYRETAEEFERIVAEMVPEYGQLMKPLLEKHAALAAAKKERNGLPDEATERSADLTREIAALDEQIGQLRKNLEPKRRDVLQKYIRDPERRAALTQQLASLGQGQDRGDYSETNAGPIAYHTRKRLELARDFPDAFENHVLAECQDASNLLEMLLLQHAVTKGEQRAKLGIVPLFEDADALQGAAGIFRDTLKMNVYSEHLQAVAEAHGAPQTQQVQLAHSDNSRRAGLPAARALIYRTHAELRQEFTRHPDVKLEFYEGGSLCDPFRGGGRAVSASINEYESWGQFKSTAQGGDLLTLFNNPHAVYRFFTRNITHNAAKLVRDDHPKPAIVEKKLTASLIGTMGDYVSRFKSEMMNRFFEAFDYLSEARYGTIGSRASKRGSDASNRVDVTQTRTIQWAEGQQHAGLTPTWVGVRTLAEGMKKQGLQDDSYHLHKYYESSALFRDVIDRFLWGLAPARTDLDYLAKRSNNHEMMDILRPEERQAFDLAVGAYTGRKPEDLGDVSTAEGRRQVLVKNIFPQVADVFADQERYTAIIRHIKDAWKPAKDDTKIDTPYLWHNALDTHLHGYEPRISDPTYISVLCQHYGIERPYAPKSNTLAR